MLQNVAEKISAYVTGVEEGEGEENSATRHVLDLVIMIIRVIMTMTIRMIMTMTIRSITVMTVP